MHGHSRNKLPISCPIKEKLFEKGNEPVRVGLPRRNLKILKNGFGGLGESFFECLDEIELRKCDDFDMDMDRGWEGMREIHDEYF